MNDEKNPTPIGPGETCIEWTGAGGNYFLAVVVERGKVIAEQWGTREEVLAWMDAQWPRVSKKFVPMVYSSVRGTRNGKNRPLRPEVAPLPMKSKKHSAG